MNESSTASCKQQAGAFTPVVNLKKCEGKQDCVRVCPANVFEVRRIDDADYRSLNILQQLKIRVHGMRVAYAPNADACLACGLCVAACPEKAIAFIHAKAGIQRLGAGRSSKATGFLPSRECRRGESAPR